MPVDLIKCAKDGTLTSPDVHDARLIGLWSSLGNVWLFIKDKLDLILCIELTGVARLRVNDFREGNIILDMTVQTGDQVAREDVLYTYGLVDADERSQPLPRIMRNFENREFKLVKINPSYGCDLICVCRDVVMTSRWKSAVEKLI